MFMELLLLRMVDGMLLWGLLLLKMLVLGGGLLMGLLLLLVGGLLLMLLMDGLLKQLKGWWWRFHRGLLWRVFGGSRRGGQGRMGPFECRLGGGGGAWAWAIGVVEGDVGGFVAGCLGVLSVAVAGEVEDGWARLSAGLVVAGWCMGACGGGEMVC